MKRVLAVVAVLTVSGCSTPLTAEAVSAAFTEEFAGLYATQQSRLGRTDVTPSGLGAVAACGRTGAADDGPGEDWVCRVRYVDQDVEVTQAFELQVKPDGCWRAEAPPTAQPAQLVDAVDASLSTNPLAEFDGCVDTSW